MLGKGKLRSWNDQKGFGFIEPHGGGKDVFIHISSFRNRARRPEIGQYITYTLSSDKQGRPCATKATLPGGRVSAAIKRVSKPAPLLIPGLFLVAVGFLVGVGKLPAIVLGVYLIASIVTFLVYAVDKSAAKKNSWRTPEKTLHWLSIFGGWPGAVVAQQTLRHKSKKASFRFVFWVTVVLNCGLLIWLMTPEGLTMVESWLPELGNSFRLERNGTIEWAD